jgi:hypothetical protein
VVGRQRRHGRWCDVLCDHGLQRESRVARGNDAFNAVQLFERAVGVTHADEWNDAQPNGNVVITRLREVADDLERAS